MTYTDWLGNEIEIGATVLYAVSNGHYAQVVIAEVLDILPVEPERRKDYHKDDQQKPYSERRVVREYDYWSYGRQFRLKVQPFYESGSRNDNDDWSLGAVALNTGRMVDWERDNDSDNWKLIYRRVLPKPVFIQNVEKVTVFELTDDVKSRLDTYLNGYVDKQNRKD